MRRFKTSLVGVLAASILGSCSSPPPLPTVETVDIDRFMGDWFVVGHIPASVEAKAFNAVESYELDEDGRTIHITYRFREGAFDGSETTLEPVGYIEDVKTKAEWTVQFMWPFWTEYLVTYLDADYSTTIIGRTARDYVWVMSRTPDVSDARYAELVEEVARQGYDTAKLRRVPHRWEPQPR